ncbi:hypothetical protein BDR26DRAFT_238537 [Obelidium mucronatum]|nr:hypothetical protein BDR26DRAFT_238537 [Obelidium mucronatum]
MQPTSKRVVIIGGGIAGLSLALALKRLNAKAAKLRSGVHYDTLVIEANSSPSEDGMHIVLWRWALEALIGDLQVGGGLSRMAAPIVGCSALDPLDIQVPLNQFPPPASRLAASAIDSELPPLVSIRRCDLIRLLMLALADPEMLSDVNVNVDGSKYLPQSANNSGLVEPLHQDELEADLAEGKWFERQDFASLLGRNNFVTGERIKLYYVHPETGKVTVEFRSGRTEVCDMLVGADGTNSSVRKLMYLNVTKQRSLLPPISPTSSTPSNAAGGSHPRPAEYSGAAVFCGVTRLHVPPTDAPDTLEASKKPIEDLRRFDVQEFVPDGRSVTIHGTVKGGWFGCTNLGNGLLGWRLIVPQEEKGGIAAGFAAMKNRELMNEAIKTNPTTGSNIMSMMGGPNSLVDQGVQRKLDAVEYG